MNIYPMMKRRTVGALAAVGVMTGVVVIPAAVAWAEPAGCSSRVTGYTSSIGQLVADGYGSCNGSATRTLRTEIKRAISGSPDPLLAATSDTHTGTSYHSHTTSCDHGLTEYYYGRAFFTLNSTYHDTATTRQTTCY